MKYRFIYRYLVIIFILTSCSFPVSKNPLESKTETPEYTPGEIISTTPQDTPNIVNTKTPPVPVTPKPTKTSRSITPTPTIYPDPWYLIQEGTPIATYNTPHESAGCSWLGVGGQVFGVDGVPELGVSILVGGTLNGYQVGSLGTTGMETNIGEGGYEVTLADHPVDSSGSLWIQIVDSIGNPLSKKIYFDTVNDCNRNFILINFIRYTSQSTPETLWNLYCPILMNRSSIQDTPAP